ncbi:MAG: AAA family ATPase [Limnospira sp. PMC 894.15]|uniref:AAA family ATPase n=1 Tax=Limnospira fusiformis PMC 851.14 TaxID=2219512 RepID=A0ABU9EQ69_LIMFS|nr:MULTISPECIES: AAA family ATPase [unclassified Limnospira]MDT9188878.1 AAA family ATPase [Limnospira sp. PMC 894.15]MDT9234714.1 AAA family ATPase [Limnospira sp. PMC 917.15]MDT9275471.1 AAA family ATPase [Limnospira sp. PMC 737.11]
MKLIIKNFGPIKNNSKAIDLSKNLLVFVGYNNSGKSYVSQLLWTIFNQRIINNFAQNNLDIIEDNLLKNAKHFEVNQELIDKIIISYSSFLRDALKKHTFKDLQASKLFDNISLDFEASIDEIKRGDLQASFTIKASDDNKIDSNYLEIKKDNNSLRFQIEEKKIPEDFLDFVPRTIVDRYLIAGKKSILIKSIILILLQYEHETFFLPASRSFLPIFYRYIYKIERKEREQIVDKLLTLMQTKQDDERINLSEIKDLNISNRPYTEPINQIIESLYSLNEKLPIVKPEFYLNLVQKLQKIMGGEINLMSQEGIAPIEFAFKLDVSNLDLPMYLASSSVNQLTLLYLYLKYWVNEKNNFLIMDEPEENLHPENQINLLNILLQFISENDNKVLITTHSPILANAINNYIYLDVLKNEYKVDVGQIIEADQLQYVDPSISVSQEKVGVYFFTGEKIVDYQSDDYGIYFRDFRKVEDNVDKSLRILTDYIYRQQDDF